MAVLRGKLTNKLVEYLRPGRHGDSACHYLIVDPFGALRWIVGGTIKGQIYHTGAPPRTDFGLGGADVVTLNTAGVGTGMPTHGQLWSGSTFQRAVPVPTYEELSQQVHIERRSTWKNAQHRRHWVNMPLLCLRKDQMYAGGQY